MSEITSTDKRDIEHHREQLGQQMAENLLRIAELTGQPIKHMRLNENSVFEEVKEQ